MKTHRLKLGQRVVIEPGLLDITGTIIALVSWPSEPCPDCGEDCPGPFYRVAEDGGQYRAEWAQHSLHAMPNPNQGDPQ